MHQHTHLGDSMTNTKRLKIPLPDNWSLNVKSAILHAISLAQFVMAYTRGWAANSINARIRLKRQVAQLEQQVACLTEQMRIKDARLQRIDSQKRPHYLPVERMAILELRAAQNWSLKQTAKAFLLTRATIRSWLARLEEEGPDALVQTARPVNRFSDCIRYLVRWVQRLVFRPRYQAAFRAASTLATAVALRRTANSGQRSTRRATDASRSPPCRLQTPADCDAQARGVATRNRAASSECALGLEIGPRVASKSGGFRHGNSRHRLCWLLFCCRNRLFRRRKRSFPHCQLFSVTFAGRLHPRLVLNRHHGRMAVTRCQIS